MTRPKTRSKSDYNQENFVAKNGSKLNLIRIRARSKS